MYCHGPASSEYSAWAMGEKASSALKVTCNCFAQGECLHSAAAAFSAETTGGVVSTSKRSLILSLARASPGGCEGASLATTLT